MCFGVGSNQKVRDDSLALASGLSVGAKYVTRRQGVGRFEWREGDAQRFKLLRGLLACIESTCDVGPDDLARQEAALVLACPQRLERTRTMLGVSGKDVDQDVRVDRRDQLGSAFPRSSETNSSVDWPSRSTP